MDYLAEGLLEVLVDDRFQILRYLKDWNVVLINLYLFSGTRISGHSPFSFLHFETPEAADLDIFAVAQRGDNSLNKSVYDRLCLNFRQSRARRNNVHDVCFGQVRSPVLLRLCKFVLQQRLMQKILLKIDDLIRNAPKQHIGKPFPFSFLHDLRRAVNICQMGGE